MRNYRPTFIEGTTNIWYLSFKDHAATNMHKRTMVLEAKEAASSLMEYVPIARAMVRDNLSKAAKLKIKGYYTSTKENLEMGVICELKIIDLAS